jgi:hypothetical protein
LSEIFSISIGIFLWFLSLLLFTYCITCITLCMMKHPCIPGMKLTWSWHMIFFMCGWIQFTSSLLRSFFFFLQF